LPAKDQTLSTGETIDEFAQNVKQSTSNLKNDVYNLGYSTGVLQGEVDSLQIQVSSNDSDIADLQVSTANLEANKLDKSSATATYLQKNEKASDSDLLDGRNYDAFVSTTGDDMNGDLDMNKNNILNVSSITFTGGGYIKASASSLKVHNDLIADGSTGWYPYFIEMLADGEGLEMNGKPIRTIDWTNSDDGSGSGLDADYLDGLDSTDFLTKSSATTTYVHKTGDTMTGDLNLGDYDLICSQLKGASLGDPVVGEIVLNTTLNADGRDITGIGGNVNITSTGIDLSNTYISNIDWTNTDRNLEGQLFTNVSTSPVNNTDIASKGYVDYAIKEATSSLSGATTLRHRLALYGGVGMSDIYNSSDTANTYGAFFEVCGATGTITEFHIAVASTTTDAFTVRVYKNGTQQTDLSMPANTSYKEFATSIAVNKADVLGLDFLDVNANDAPGGVSVVAILEE